MTVILVSARNLPPRVQRGVSGLGSTGVPGVPTKGNILPERINRLHQGNLFAPAPSFRLLFPGNRGLNI